MQSTTTRTKAKEIREQAIADFKKYHGNHSHDVEVSIDYNAFLKVAEHYKGRVDLNYYKSLFHPHMKIT